jgi:cardiolipin synthase
MSELMHWIGHIVFLADLLIRIGLSVRVILRRLPVGVSLAWLAIILVFPFAGSILYLLFGEPRLGRRRTQRAAQRQAVRARLPKVPESLRAPFESLRTESAAVARLAEATLGAVALAGNQLTLLPGADSAFPALIADIDRAQRTCDLEFYIWSEGGRADLVAAAVVRAAQRGVACRVLVDALGSRPFLKSATIESLRKAGVRVEAALPAGLVRLLFVRPDLRLHRKIAIIDDAVGYTGSLNLADPNCFKQKAGVGKWVDALARLEGPAVGALADTFREDWELETGEASQPAGADGPARAKPGQAAVQVLPTGPDGHTEAIEQVVLMALYGARREVVLTTPYFVPSEPLLIALLSAASRGIDVTLIVPAHIDSRMVQYASQANQTDLLKAGVRVALYRGGLLHTKSICVDGEFSLFGSLNLDLRSFRLNFEITLAVYDAGFTGDLRRLQQSYLDDSDLLDLAACRARSAIERFTEDSARLAGPVL